MSFHRMALSLALIVSVAGPLAAQSADQRALEVRVRGGGYSALRNLDAAGAADTKLGFNAGGGVGLRLNRHVGVRADFTFAKDELRASGVETGTHLQNYFYTAAIQLQYPTSSGLTPYVLAGAGGVTINEEDTSDLDRSRVAGLGGIGLSYRIPNSRVALFTEGLGYFYKVRDVRGSLAGFDRTQVDVAWSAGFSYTFKL